jgi:hypothetical protein
MARVCPGALRGRVRAIHVAEFANPTGAKAIEGIVLQDGLSSAVFTLAFGFSGVSVRCIPARRLRHLRHPGGRARMGASADLTRYFVWAGVVVVGALFAIVDRRWIGRPVFGVVLAAGVVVGFIVTEVSPFSFGGGSHFMEGVIVAAGSALALGGYVAAAVWQFVRRRIGGYGRS